MQEVATLEARDVEELRETLDRLRDEVAELRASRERLVLAADADRHGIERALHDGVQQHLVALAVNLQQAVQLAVTEPPAARALLQDLERDVQRSLDEAAQLAQRVYPALLDSQGLGAALRSVAATARVPVRVEATVGAGNRPEIVRAAYFCVLDVLEQARPGSRVTVTVRDENGALAFEVFEDDSGAGAPATPHGELERLRDRVEALGGGLSVQSEPGRSICVSGFLPLSR